MISHLTFVIEIGNEKKTELTPNEIVLNQRQLNSLLSKMTFIAFAITHINFFPSITAPLIFKTTFFDVEFKSTNDIAFFEINNFV